MNIDQLKSAIALLEMLNGEKPAETIQHKAKDVETIQHKAKPVVVWTDKRGVIFGYTENADARPITLKNARMCLYWDTSTGGVFGLCDKGPNSNCKISATLPSAVFEGVTGVADVSEMAEEAWISAKVQGR